MSGVTDADRERATGVVEQITGAPWDVLSDAEWRWVDAIAAALAEEREKARAPFLALAEKWEADAQRSDDAEPVDSDGLTRMILAARFLRMNASDVRRTAEETA